MNAQRPAGVTLVAVLSWIGGALNVVFGGLLLIASGFAAGPDTTIAIINVVIGLLTILIAGGLLKGNTAARMIITVLQVFTIASTGSHLFLGGVSPVSDIISITISVIVLLILWSRKSNAFFRR